jgi:UPF0148 protein
MMGKMPDAEMKDMAELLRSGARMLSRSCPECGSPLFQLKTGEMWCAKCQRRVVVVQEGESPQAGMQLDSLERALLDRLSSLEAEIVKTNDPAGLKELAEVADAVLTVIERLRRIKKG